MWQYSRVANVGMYFVRFLYNRLDNVKFPLFIPAKTEIISKTLTLIFASEVSPPPHPRFLQCSFHHCSMAVMHKVANELKYGCYDATSRFHGDYMMSLDLNIQHHLVISSLSKATAVHFSHYTKSLVDPGGALPAPPQQDSILSFLLMFLPKIAHIGGRCPPQWLGAPTPTGNPGSATESNASFISH